MKAGWEVKPLGEVCDVLSGFAFKSADYCEAGHFLVRIGNVQDSELVLDKPKYVALDNKTKRFELNSGDILTSLTGNIGRVAVVEDHHLPAALNQRVARLARRSERDLDYRYFLYFLYSDCFGEPLRELSHGAAQQNVSPKAISNLPIPIPPLEEQKRIVAVLDAAFEGLTRAKENAETNLQNARELFERFLSASYIKACEKWPEQPLGECLEKITYGFTNPMPDTDEGPFKVTAKNVIGGKVDLSTAKHTSLEAFNELLTDKSRPEIGDVLITKDGTLGRTAVVETAGLCINQSVAVMRPKAHLSSHFLRTVLSEQTVQDRLIEDAGGATIKHLYITRIPKVKLGIPSDAEQKLFLKKMDEFRLKSDVVVEKYKAKLTDIAGLRQSLLQKAFAGELT